MNSELIEQFNKTLNRYAHLAPNDVQQILDAGSFDTYKKADIIFHENRYNAFEYFQLDGISHRYNTDEESQMITTGIYQDDIVLTPHFARTKDGKSIFSLQALSECSFLKVPIGSFDQLRKENESIRSFGQRVVEKEFIRHLNYEVLFRSHSAKDRLLYFRDNYPMLENLVPHTVIASFLGITPVSFSRLRNELSKK